MLGAVWKADVLAHRRFLNNIMAKAGDPDDPMEVMLIEQLSMCHVLAAALHTRAGEQSDRPARLEYCATAIRLTGEFRKLTATLAGYRESRCRLATRKKSSDQAQAGVPGPGDAPKDTSGSAPATDEASPDPDPTVANV